MSLKIPYGTRSLRESSAKPAQHTLRERHGARLQLRLALRDGLAGLQAAHALGILGLQRAQVALLLRVLLLPRRRLGLRLRRIRA